MESKDRNIRIGVFTKPLDKWFTGSGHHLDEIMRHVLDINDAQGKPIDFTFIHYNKSENPIYSRVKELLIPRNPLVASYKLSKHDFDVLHYSPLSIYAPMWGLSAKKIATIHGVEERLFPQGYTLSARLHERLAMPILARRLDRIATVSNTSATFFNSAYRIPQDKIIITPNALSSSYRVLPQNDDKALNRMGATRPYILHISRQSPRKNPECILQGFAEFRKKHPEFSLVCAGKGWDDEPILNEVRRLALDTVYSAPGFITEEEAVELYNGASAFVFPSHAEGFGMPNLEAMASGCPVITSSIFAIPEVVADAAILLQDQRNPLELSQALCRIVEDDDFRNTLRQKGLNRIRDFDWKESARTLFTTYLELASDAKISR